MRTLHRAAAAWLFVSMLLGSSFTQAREAQLPASGARPAPALPASGARGDTLFLFAASGPGSFGSPGTDARGFTFDHAGGPAPAGWFGVDLTTDEAVWWHVANTDICAGTGTDMSQALPFDSGDTVNDYALWCGRHEVCSWVYGQTGYGRSWDQYAIVDFSATPVQQTLTIDLAYRSSFEGEDYDWFTLFVEVDGVWQSVWEEHNPLDETFRELSFTLPEGEIGGPGAATRVAFHFRSDGGWCDEDGLFPTDIGAVWLDNIAIDVDGAPVFASDFESGLLPAGLSLEVGPGLGDFAALRTGVAQPEAAEPNESYFWTFFDPALANEDYPDGVVPYGPPYAQNVIEGPVLAVDQHGAPLDWRQGDLLFVETSVYFDMPPLSYVTVPFPEFAAITADGCQQRWESAHTVFFPPEPWGWRQVVLERTQDLLDSAGGGEIVGIKVRPSGVEDVLGIWGPPYDFHAAGPFVDNVRIYILRDTETAVAPAPAASALIGAQPNPFNPKTTIRFSLAEAGRARLEVFDLAGRRVAMLLDGPAAAGEQSIDWDGRDDAGRRLASGVYLLRFAAAGVSEEGKLVLLK